MKIETKPGEEWKRRSAKSLRGDARRIYLDLTSADAKTIKGARGIDAEQAQDWFLKRAMARGARAPSDADLYKLFAGLKHAGADESAIGSMVSQISGQWKSLSKTYLKNVVKVCRAVIDDFKQSGVGHGVTNVVRCHDFRDLLDYGIQCLDKANDPIRLFRYGTEIAAISKVNETDSASIQVLDTTSFRTYVSTLAPYKKLIDADSGTTEGIAAPWDVVEHLYTWPELRLPYLAGIIRIPTYAPDWTLLQTPGYNAESYLYHIPPRSLSIPPVSQTPTADDVRRARVLLVHDLCGEFRFDGATPEELIRSALGNEDGTAPYRSGDPVAPASLMNALGLLFTPFVRPAIKGKVPATVASKPAPGTGATALIEAFDTIVSGSVSVRPPMDKDESERRKAIFTALNSSRPFLFFDNMLNMDSPTIAALLTATTWTDRVLGRSQEREVPVNAALVFTGNNPSFSTELQRRISLIRLDARMADPKSRTFRLDRESWVPENRGRLIWAVLTLIANWRAKGGKPAKHAPSWNSYGEWTRTIGGILEAADPRWITFQGNRDEIAQLASAGTEEPVGDLVRAWADAVDGGVIDADNVSCAGQDGLAELAEAQEISLPGVRRKRDHQSGLTCYCPHALAKYLNSYKGRFFDLGDGREAELVKEPKGRHGVPWSIRIREMQPEVDGSPVGEPAEAKPDSNVISIHRNALSAYVTTGTGRRRRRSVNPGCVDRKSPAH